MHASQRIAPRRSRLCVAILGGLALYGGTTAPVMAQSSSAASPVARTFAFDVPAGDLAAALDAIGKASGRLVVFDRDAVAGLKSQAVKGSMTEAQAVAAAVAGTKLAVSEDASGAVRVGAYRLNTVTILAKRDQAETGFKADRSDTATRSGTDLMDVPGSVTVITSKVLETQQATSIRDTLRNVSGIGFTESPQGVPTYSVRGFAQSSVTSNGVSDPDAAFTNVFGVERVEVLKGPQAILAGGDSLGGGVNVVTKKPTADTIRELTLQYGSHADATVAADLSDSFSKEDKRLTYRLIGAETRAGKSYAGYDGRKEDYLMPQLRWKDESTDLIVGVSYDRVHLPVAKYTFARRDGVILPPPDMQLTNPRDGFDVTDKRAFYQLEQKITPDITLVSRMQQSDEDLTLHVWSPGGLRYDSGAAPSQPNGMGDFFPSYSTTSQRQISGDHYLRMHFWIGDFDNKLSVGFGHSDLRHQQTGYGNSLPFGGRVRATLYPAIPVDWPTPESVDTSLSFISNVRQKQTGYFVQDLVSWNDWSLLLNLRRNRYSLSDDANFVSAGFTSSDPPVTINKTTPGVGVLYRWSDRTSLYASYSEGFVPQTTVSCDGGLVPPITTKNKEAGAKFQLLDNKLSLTGAVFQVDESNQLNFDSINSCYVVRPSQRTQGVELDVQGQLAPGWNLIANYTHQGIKDVQDPTRLFPGFPHDKLSLWTTYTLPLQSLKGLGVGLGVNATGSQDGSIDTRFPFKVPAQVQLDASLFYEQPKWTVTLGVKNIADRKLYGISTSNSYIPISDGRTFMLTLKTKFD
jgi:iron complex outermembrane receptor protein